MPFRDEAVGTFNQTVGVKIDMDEAVRILTPSDVPLQQMLPVGSTVQVKTEWMEEDLMPQSIVNATVANSGPWTLTTADTSELRVGDVLHLRGAAPGVQFVVDSITDGTTYVVSGFAGNTTTPGGTGTLDIIGQYIVEGSDPVAPRSTERVGKFNYTEILQEQVAATRTARVRGSGGGLYGQGDPYDHELMKKYKELAIRFERNLILGQRAISGDAKQRSMGGLFYYITEDTSNTANNIKALLNLAVRKGYDAGGSGQYTLVCSPSVKAIISSLNDSIVDTSRTDRGAGTVITSFESDFGTVNIIPNRHMPVKRGVLLNGGDGGNDVEILNLTPYTHELLAKTGDSDKGHIVAEKTLKVKNEAAMGTITVSDAT